MIESIISYDNTQHSNIQVNELKTHSVQSVSIRKYNRYAFVHFGWFKVKIIVQIAWVNTCVLKGVKTSEHVIWTDDDIIFNNTQTDFIRLTFSYFPMLLLYFNHWNIKSPIKSAAWCGQIHGILCKLPYII